MPRGIAKANLPQKSCATCGKPFTWRKKWEKVWEQVRYCSDRCRGGERAAELGSRGPYGQSAPTNRASLPSVCRPSSTAPKPLAP